MIKEVLDILSVEERRRLYHAFDNEIAQHVDLPENHFVGVNISAPNFEIKEKVGAWSYGKRISS